MLIGVDLDDTLLNRTEAYSAWVDSFCLSHDRVDEAPWLRAHGRSGTLPHTELAAALSERWGISEVGLAEVVRGQHLAWIIARSPIERRKYELSRLRSENHRVVILTNGEADWQVAKIRALRLDQFVDGWFISGPSGVRKPQREFFDMAAQRWEAPAVDWVVGDNPATDIAGGRRHGAKTGWVSHARQWPVRAFAPTVSGTDVIDVLRQIR